jgi:hypothetical protein
MRRMLWLACAGALIAPASAHADLLDTYRRLDLRSLTPAPLVPTTVPPIMRPIDSTITTFPTRRRSAYGIRLVHYTPNGPDAVLALSGGDYKNMAAARRDHRGQRHRSLRVRGRRALLFTSHGDRELVWREGGRVFDMGSGTPRKVSVAQMRATAAGLEPLGHYYIGGSSDPNSSADADLATTAHTVSVRIEFNANCTFTPHAGQAEIYVAPLRGGSFSFDVAQHRVGSAPWTGTISGTVSADSATVDYRVAGTIDGEQCSGAETLTLPRNHSR